MVDTLLPIGVNNLGNGPLHCSFHCQQVIDGPVLVPIFEVIPSLTGWLLFDKLQQEKATEASHSGRRHRTCHRFIQPSGIWKTSGFSLDFLSKDWKCLVTITASICYVLYIFHIKLIYYFRKRNKICSHVPNHSSKATSHHKIKIVDRVFRYTPRMVVHRRCPPAIEWICLEVQLAFLIRRLIPLSSRLVHGSGIIQQSVDMAKRVLNPVLLLEVIVCEYWVPAMSVVAELSGGLL